MILGIGFLLLVSLVISAVLSSLTQVLGTFLGGTALVAHVLDLVVSFTFVSVLFAMIYKFLPDVRFTGRTYRWRRDNFVSLYDRKVSDWALFRH